MEVKNNNLPISFPYFSIRRMSILLIIMLLAVSPHSFAREVDDYAQTRRLNLSFKAVNLQRVLQEIEKQSEFLFFYQSEDIDVSIKITIERKDATIHQVLEDLRKQTKLKYTIQKKHIIITDEGREKEKISNPLASSSFNDKETITGWVQDTLGNRIMGASIFLKGSQTTTSTDEQGRFFFKAPSKGVLKVSYVGYLSKEVNFDNDSPLTIILNERIENLDEIIVVAYGEQKESIKLSAVSHISGVELNKSNAANLSNTIAGRLAGVSIRPISGKPGEDNPTFYIRGVATTGNKSPLIVIDGIIRDNINQVNMNDIESVSILKDATAIAPYGLGGANGVMLITTKSGKEGKAKLTLNSYFGIQRPTVIPQMLNAQDYMRLRNEAYLNDNNHQIPTGGALPFSEQLIADYQQLHATNPDEYPNSNYINEMVKLNTPIESYSAQVSGGSPQTNYYLGVGYFNQKGMYDNLYYRRYSINSKVDFQVFKDTRLLLSMNGTVENRNAGPSPIGISYTPIHSLYYSNGLWGESGGKSPLGELNSGSYDRFNNNTLLLSVGLEQKLPFIKGLRAKAVLSYDPNFQYRKTWTKPYYYYLFDSRAETNRFTRTVNGQEITSLRQQDDKNDRYTGQFYLNYNRSFGKHEIGGLAVFEARDTRNRWIMAARRGFQLELDELNFGPSDKIQFDNAGSSSRATQTGLVYRFNYSYSQKYLMEASGRYDGHSFFAPGRRWAFFPAFSFGWRISEESFLKNKTNWLNDLKIRGSWGKAGNLTPNAFQYLSVYNLINNAYLFGDSFVQGSEMRREPNPSITWEVSRSSNIGIDATLFNGRISVAADVFQQKRSGMLLSPNVTVPVEYGLALAEENAGVMTNRGVEFELGGKHSFANGLALNVNANFSYAKNRMDQVYESLDTYNNTHRRRTGRPWLTPFGYKAVGLFSTADDKNGDGIINANDGYYIDQFGAILYPGDVKYADLSGPNGQPDGKIDSWDETVVGYAPYPRITYGFTLGASWKGFDLSAFFQGAAQASINIQGYQTIPFRLNNANVSYEYFNNYWRPDRQNAIYPRISQAPAQKNTTNLQYSNGFGPYSSSFWMRNTNYLRLKNLVIGYTLPKKLTQKAGISALRFYLSGDNIFTWSSLNFMDPETNYELREESYPLQKNYTVGMNISF